MSSMSPRARRMGGYVAIGALLLLSVVGAYRNSLAKSEESYKGLKMLSDVIEIVEKNYVDEVDSKQLIEKAVQGMVSSLDPHSALLPPDAFKELQIDTQGEFTGIGVSITMKDDAVTVIAPIEGTPAYKAGIKAGDRIVKVDGNPIKDLREAVARMRGPRGTEVAVTISREGVTEPMEFILLRDLIPIQSVHHTRIRPGYGYVWITHFREQTVQDLESATQELEGAGEPLQGLILDLRDNPGGLLPQAIAVADLFLEQGDILHIKGRLKQHTKTYTARPGNADRKYPIVVLINGGSASASEIVAGALQDNRRAIVLGTPSFGKGSVQTVESLREGYGLKLTIARYYTPNGTSIQARGIQPDIFVKQAALTGPSEEESGAMLREQDLQNHLEAEPMDEAEPDQPADGKAPQPKAPGPPEPLGGEPGELNIEKLETDNQVQRALDILIGYHILTR